MESKWAPTRFVEKEYVRHTGRRKQVGAGLVRAPQKLGLSPKNRFRQEGHRVSGMTHGDDFVLTEPTGRLT